MTQIMFLMTLGVILPFLSPLVMTPTVLKIFIFAIFPSAVALYFLLIVYSFYIVVESEIMDNTIQSVRVIDVETERNYL